ncbi:unnamed protein product [Arctogadus glacialis]
MLYHATDPLLYGHKGRGSLFLTDDTTLSFFNNRKQRSITWHPICSTTINKGASSDALQKTVRVAAGD